MKLLKKLLLIKWYYIEHELIDFDTINFMTGKNGSGKSTIIDALQIVMLGDTRGNFFNKAANDRSGRTLDGYLKGEMTDDGDVGFRTKRSGRFTSYIAAEFWDTTERKSFTCGVVFDSYKDAPTDHVFFILNDTIPENHFIHEETKTPMDRNQLKAYFNKNYSASKVNLYQGSNNSYQENFLAKIGAIKPKFFRLFKKSVTFTPIENIESFISEYVCDVTNEIDIESMKENIRHYKQMEKEATQMGERKKELERIEGEYNDYRDIIKQKEIQHYIMLKSNLAFLNDEFETLQSKISNNEKDIETLKEKESTLQNQIEHLSQLKSQKENEKAESDINRKLDSLKQQLVSVNDKLNRIEEKTNDIIKKFRNKIVKWHVNVQQLIDRRTLVEDSGILSILQNLKDNLEYLLSFTEENIETIDENVLSETKEQMKQINYFANEIYFHFSQKEKEDNNSLTVLDGEIKQLKQGIKPYKPQLVEFKEILKEKLEEEYHEEIDISILADLLEIKNVAWKDAIESYMNRQMFYLVLAPKYYNRASKIYQELAKNGKYYGFGLIDVKRILQSNPSVETGSLAEEIEVENPYAKTYIDYILGKVIKCEKVEQLRNYKTSITMDGMLYKNYVLRKIMDKNHEFHFIGKKSIDEQIRIKQEEVERMQKEIAVNEVLKNITFELKNAEIFSDDEIKDRKDDLKLIRSNAEVKQEKENIEKKMTELDLTWLDKVTNEIKELEEKMRKLSAEKEKNHDTYITREEQNRTLKENNIPKLEQNILEKSKEISSIFDNTWMTEYGNPEFEKIISHNYKQMEKNAEKEYIIWEEKESKKYEVLTRVRSEYVQKHQFSYDILNKNSNAEFSNELIKIKEIQLPQYIQKIQDSKEKAYQQFKEDFISKLKANIDEVENQIDELNDALKESTFGVDKYLFKVKPKQEYKRFYDMITDTMLMEGHNLFSEAFYTKYHEEVDELFKKITCTDNYEDTYQKNVSLYTDYKTYLSFDLTVTDKEGHVQRLSRTLNKKSGGETQTPFYISVLASFAQLYRINKNRNDNTLRLIVFDEAFNKMDEDRMQESLKLLGRFGFQAIIAAPSEKAGEIIPYVRNTLCVIRKGTNTIVRKYEKGLEF